MFARAGLPEAARAALVERLSEAAAEGHSIEALRSPGLRPDRRMARGRRGRRASGVVRLGAGHRPAVPHAGARRHPGLPLGSRHPRPPAPQMGAAALAAGCHEAVAGADPSARRPSRPGERRARAAGDRVRDARAGFGRGAAVAGREGWAAAAWPWIGSSWNSWGSAGGSDFIRGWSSSWSSRRPEARSRQCAAAMTDMTAWLACWAAIATIGARVLRSAWSAACERRPGVLRACEGGGAMSGVVTIDPIRLAIPSKGHLYDEDRRPAGRTAGYKEVRARERSPVRGDHRRPAEVPRRLHEAGGHRHAECRRAGATWE